MQNAAIRRAALGRRARVLLCGAGVSLVGYFALAVFAAQQQFFALDYGTRAWVQTVRLELFDLPMELVSLLGEHEAASWTPAVEAAAPIGPTPHVGAGVGQPAAT